MLSITSHAALGDPKYGGALFLLAREIRDQIYGLLFQGRYRTACVLQHPFRALGHLEFLLSMLLSHVATVKATTSLFPPLTASSLASEFMHVS